MKCISGGILLQIVVDESTFGHYGSLDHLILAWIVLFDPPLYMGMAMIKGTQKYVGVFFGGTAWCISRHGWEDKLSQP